MAQSYQVPPSREIVDALRTLDESQREAQQTQQLLLDVARAIAKHASLITEAEIETP